MSRIVDIINNNKEKLENLESFVDVVWLLSLLILDDYCYEHFEKFGREKSEELRRVVEELEKSRGGEVGNVSLFFFVLLLLSFLLLSLCVFCVSFCLSLPLYLPFYLFCVSLFLFLFSLWKESRGGGGEE